MKTAKSCAPNWKSRTIRTQPPIAQRSPYSGFTVSFSETVPGGSFPTLNFGLTASPGALGVADHIDYRNKVVVDTARVFSANFAFIIESGDPRATQISELSAALAGTGAHELAHNFGLRHHDAYAVTSLSYTGTPIATGGAQNASIMATGSTGLTEIGRETDRTFSDLSKVKLSFAGGLNSLIVSSVVEGSDFGGTTGTAKHVSFNALSAINLFAANIVGTIGTTVDVDVFSFDLLAGSTFTADVNIDFGTGIPFTNVNTKIELVDINGSTVIASDLVSRYSGNTFGSGGFGDGFDPMIFHAMITTAGKYFLRIAPEVADSGNYELLIYTNMLDSPLIPLPSSAALALVGVGLVGIRRRRN